MFRRIDRTASRHGRGVFGGVLDGAEAERVGLVLPLHRRRPAARGGPRDGRRAASAPRELGCWQGDDQGLADVADHPAAVAASWNRRSGDPPALVRRALAAVGRASRERADTHRVLCVHGRSSHRQRRSARGATGRYPNEPATSHRGGARRRRRAPGPGHSESHRIHVELQDVANQSRGLDHRRVHETGAAWKPTHHRAPKWPGSWRPSAAGPCALEAEDVEAPQRPRTSAGRGLPPRRSDEKLGLTRGVGAGSVEPALGQLAGGRPTPRGEA